MVHGKPLVTMWSWASRKVAVCCRRPATSTVGVEGAGLGNGWLTNDEGRGQHKDDQKHGGFLLLKDLYFRTGPVRKM